MKRFLIGIAALAFASAAHAQDFDTSGGSAYHPSLPIARLAPETAAQIREAEDAARADYEAVKAAGGCNADFQPHWIAAHCFNWATHGDLNGGPIGASHGGSD